MSVQFGRWNFDGKPVEQDYLEKVQPLLLPYGPEDHHSNSTGCYHYAVMRTSTRPGSRDAKPAACHGIGRDHRLGWPPGQPR